MHAPKKVWVKPHIAPVEISQARDKISTAISVMEQDPALADACTDLRSILEALDDLKTGSQRS